MTTHNAEHLLEDLRLHQAELAAQNAELCQFANALSQSEARFRVLFELGPLPSFTLRWSGEIIEINAAARSFVLMPPAGFGSIQQLVLPGFAVAVRALISEADRKGRAEVELGVRTVLGVRLALATLVRVLEQSQENEQRTFILAMQDLTLLRSAEAQRDQERAERLRAVGLLAGAIAHDFGNSLQAIRTNLEVAMAAESRESLLLAMQSLDSAAGMCRQLLDYIGQRRGQDADCDLAEVSLGTVRLCDPHGQELRMRPRSRSGDLRVAVGSTAVHQILLNLLRNASEASEHGYRGVAVRIGRGVAQGGGPSSPVGQDQLAVGSFCAVIVVSDHGCGMDSLQQRRSIDPFFTTKANGHGLGLSTVFGLVRGSGGNLRLWSKRGRGTVVRIELPLASLRDGPVSTGRPPAIAERSLSILVVDDEKSIRDALGRMLRLQGHRVQVCADGAEALSVLLAPGADFDGAVVDITMPGMSGIQVAKRVREVSPSFPMVLCSGFAANVALGTEQLPPDVPLLQKPISTTELVQTLMQGAC